MFTISPALMQQCIDMVAKGQDYIKVQEIVIPEQKAVGLFYVVYTILYDNRLQQCGNSCYCSREEAEAIYTACSEHIPVVMYSYVYGGAMHEVKRNY